MLVGVEHVSAQESWQDSLLNSIFKAKQGSLAAYEQEQIALRNSLSRHYLNDDWVEGAIVPKGANDLKLPGVRLKYRVYDDQMQAEYNNSVYIIDPDKVDAVILGWQIFINAPFEVDNYRSKSFFQQLNQGEILLLKRWKMAIKRSDYDPQLNTGIKEDIIFPETEYFIKRPGEPAYRLKKKKKILFRLLPEYKNDLKTVMRQEKLNLKREADIIRMIDYCNGR